MEGRNGFVNRFIKQQPKRKKIELNKDNAYQICPFNIIGGFITSTENGIVSNDNSFIEDYSTFQRVFTGLENLLVVWEDAFLVQKDTEDATHLTKIPNFAGRTFWGSVNSVIDGATFEPSPIDNVFLQETTNQTITVFSYEEITDADLYKLYLIPKLNGNKWMYISNSVKYYNTAKEFEHVEITFTSLNEKIAQTGGAVEQFVHRSAPGEGYAWPLINKNGIIETDPVLLRDRPITSMQDEFSCGAAINTIFAYGRPVNTEITNNIITYKFNEKIEASRLLLPYAIETPQTSILNTKPATESNFYYGHFKPTLWSNFDNWKKPIQANYDLEQQNKYEGVLVATDTTKLKNSNPVLPNDETHNHILWDNQWRVNPDNEYEIINAMAKDKLSLKKDMNINEILAHNYFASAHIENLPLEIEQNITWHAKDIPLIGGFLNKLSLGIPWGWQNHAIRIGIKSIGFLIPVSTVEYGNKTMDTPTDVQIPLSIFTGKQQGEQYETAGLNDIGTSIKIGLTDLFNITIQGVEYTLSTVHLGLNCPLIDENGTTIPHGPSVLLWDETCKPAPRKVAGYVIDVSASKVLCKNNFRRTFFTNDIQDWTGTYKTQSSFTNSIRDWTNVIKMSKWESVSPTPVHYPTALLDPKPPTVNYPNIKFNPLSGIQMEPTEFAGFLKTTPCITLALSNDVPEYPKSKKVKLNYFVEGDISFVYDNDGFKSYQLNTYTRGGSWGSNTWVNDGNWNEKIIASFDTTPHGGIATFLQNYSKLEFSYLRNGSYSETKRNWPSVYNTIMYQPNPTTATADITRLLQLGELTILDEDMSSNSHKCLYRTGESDLFVCDYFLDNNNYTENTLMDLDINHKLKLKIDGSYIRIYATISYRQKGVNAFILTSKHYTNGGDYVMAQRKYLPNSSSNDYAYDTSYQMIGSGFEWVFKQK